MLQLQSWEEYHLEIASGTSSYLDLAHYHLRTKNEDKVIRYIQESLFSVKREFWDYGRICIFIKKWKLESSFENEYFTNLYKEMEGALRTSHCITVEEMLGNSWKSNINFTKEAIEFSKYDIGDEKFYFNLFKQEFSKTSSLKYSAYVFYDIVDFLCNVCQIDWKVYRNEMESLKEQVVSMLKAHQENIDKIWSDYSKNQRVDLEEFFFMFSEHIDTLLENEYQEHAFLHGLSIIRYATKKDIIQDETLIAVFEILRQLIPIKQDFRHSEFISWLTNFVDNYSSMDGLKIVLKELSSFQNASIEEQFCARIFNKNSNIIESLTLVNAIVSDMQNTKWKLHLMTIGFQFDSSLEELIEAYSIIKSDPILHFYIGELKLRIKTNKAYLFTYFKMNIYEAQWKGFEDEYIHDLESKALEVLNWNDSDSNLLCLFCEYRHYNLANKLLDRGVDIQFRSKNGSNALLATFNNLDFDHYHEKIDLLKRLLKLGIEVNVRSNIGAINCAANMGNLEILKLMVNSGAKLEYTGDQGKQLLIEAASKAKLDALKYLVSIGCSAKNINTSDIKFEYFYDNRQEVMDFLISSGAK